MALDLYLDTADTSEWDRLMPTGMFRGITTNPLLAHRAGLDYPAIDWAELAARAADLGAQELHAQVYGPPEGYAAWAERLLEAGQKAGLRTVVKVPLVEDAIRRVPALKSMGCPILMTACYDPKQMYVACGLGADFIAPYFGRMLEADMPAYEMMAQMLAIGSGAPTRILVASLRSAEQMFKLSEMGCDCFTISPDLGRGLLSNPMTTAAYAQFESAARETE
ncbi:MAG: transaldolase family protein [Pseudomonadota bacterium]